MIFRRGNFSVLMAILAAARQVQDGDSLGLFNKDAICHYYLQFGVANSIYGI